ncbi:MAG: hypothetical protein KGN16_06030 [Burkholderiales bacterium]|nr:hypothetical protein [Burkholderiales bacterium]
MSSHFESGATAPGPVTPESDEARGQAGFKRQGTEDSRDCAVNAAQRKFQAEKAATTLIAEAALVGVELAQLADRSWMASRWGLGKTLADMPAVRAWLARLRGRP